MQTLAGREKEFKQIIDILRDKGREKTIIGIEGEAGIGKTLLADRICDTAIRQGLFTSIYRVSAYNSTWERVIRTLGNEILGFYTKATAEELQKRIVAEATNNTYLIFIDNLDDDVLMKDVQNLIEKWTTVKTSVLLLTGQNFPDDFKSKDYYESISLRGLTAESDINALLGGQLSTLLRDDRTNLFLEIPKVTKGNPQKLLYLRWLAPQNVEEFREWLNRIDKDEKEQKIETAIEAINRLLRGLEFPVEHFLSIANLRSPVFDENLLAYLWDRLGGGSTEFFKRSLDRLIGVHLLDIITKPRDSGEEQKPDYMIEYRLNTTIHGRLQTGFYKLVAPERQAQIQFFLGNFFRARFASAYDSFLQDRKSKSFTKEIRFPIGDLDSYVYHTINGGYIESAFQYLFSRGIIEWAHSAGSSLELKQILEKLLDRIDEMRSDSNAPLSSNLQQGLRAFRDEAKKLSVAVNSESNHVLPNTIRYHLEGIAKSIRDEIIDERNLHLSDAKLECMKVIVHSELGRTYKDLNQHDEALKHLNLAKDSMNKKRLKIELKKLGSQRLLSDVYHYLGIVYSVTGRPDECLAAYFGGIEYAAKNDCFNARDALSMGYLAYELKFYDINAALVLADDSVAQAKRTNDSIVEAKNLCTLGQIQSFMGKWEESGLSFTAAGNTLAGKDDRELCRIKIDSSVNYIYKRDFTMASALLNFVSESFGKTGDRRRIAMAEAYLGIIDFHNGRKEDGIKAIKTAFDKHQKLTTKREAIYEAMTCLWMITKKYPAKNGKLKDELEFVKNGRYENAVPIEIVNFLQSLNDADRDYERFWHNHYRPTLLVGIERRTT